MSRPAGSLTRCSRAYSLRLGNRPVQPRRSHLLVDDLEGLWARIKDQVQVVNPLERTPWGTYRFVISDPDGHLLAFGQMQGAGTSP